MNLLKQSVVPRRRKTDRLAWEQTVASLALALCPPAQLEAESERLKRYRQQGLSHVHVFPVWHRYRWQAQKIARVQQALPVLKVLPLPVSAFLANILFQE